MWTVHRAQCLLHPLPHVRSYTQNTQTYARAQTNTHKEVRAASERLPRRSAVYVCSLQITRRQLSGRGDWGGEVRARKGVGEGGFGGGRCRVGGSERERERAAREAEQQRRVLLPSTRTPRLLCMIMQERRTGEGLKPGQRTVMRARRPHSRTHTHTRVPDMHNHKKGTTLVEDPSSPLPTPPTHCHNVSHVLLQLHTRTAGNCSSALNSLLSIMLPPKVVGFIVCMWVCTCLSALFWKLIWRSLFIRGKL